MKTLRELQAYPSDQAYLCNDMSVAEKFNLPCPFRCGEPIWKGYGLVSVMIVVGNGLETGWVDIRNLSALDPGETFPCEPTPLWESMGFNAWAAHRRHQPWWHDGPEEKTRFEKFLDCEIETTHGPFVAKAGPIKVQSG